jgi:hypothetical protein
MQSQVKSKPRECSVSAKVVVEGRGGLHARTAGCRASKLDREMQREAVPQCSRTMWVLRGRGSGWVLRDEGAVAGV